jgi:PhnB protein
MSEANQSSRRQFIGSALSTTARAALATHSIADAQMQAMKGDEMTTLTPYLLLDGKCQQAMEFYKFCFGGELTLTKVKDSPIRDQMPAVQQEKVLNARLRSAELETSASDWLRPDRSPIRGNTVCLYLSRGTLQELKALFERLSEKAEVTDPLKEQFFWHVRSTQRQVWCPVDVSNRQEGLGKRYYGNKTT